MIREYTATGATVEEAIENACRELGVSPLDVRFSGFPKRDFLRKFSPRCGSPFSRTTSF